MFFKPDIIASLTKEDNGEPYELYSDWHKEAFGCRPGIEQSRRYDAMSPIERKVEHSTISAWFEEDARIQAMREEVAKFDFSRRMEYLMRREGISERDAFAQACTADNGDDPRVHMGHTDWGYICYNWRLPYSCEHELKAEWERLNG